MGPSKILDMPQSLQWLNLQNSGLWQGRLVKRGRIPKNDAGECWHWKDLDIGKDICIYGKVFHTVSCDLFTKVSLIFSYLIFVLTITTIIKIIWLCRTVLYFVKINRKLLALNISKLQERVKCFNINIKYSQHFIVPPQPTSTILGRLRIT